MEHGVLHNGVSISRNKIKVWGLKVFLVGASEQTDELMNGFGYTHTHMRHDSIYDHHLSLTQQHDHSRDGGTKIVSSPVG